jgi:drug/metabolite transporter (DMT)-like permease
VVPAIGLVLGALFLGETVTWRVLAGFALVVGGIGMASFLRPRTGALEQPQDEQAVTAG